MYLCRAVLQQGDQSHSVTRVLTVLR